MAEETSTAVRNALVLGATGRLGSAVAQGFLKRGYRVLGTGFTQKAALDKFHCLDVTSRESLQDFETWLEGEVSRIDVAVHAIGVVRDRLVCSMTREEWSLVLDVNLKSVFTVARILLKRWLAQHKGHLIVVGSWAGRVGREGQANYAAAKAGLMGWVQSFAKEYASRGILANVVVPGVFESSMLKDSNPLARYRLLEGSALPRNADLEETAGFIVGLAEMNGVTGQIFQLDSRIKI